MKRLGFAVAALGAATSLAACSKPDSAAEKAAKPAAASAAVVEAASDSPDMSGMSMASGEVMAKGTGAVIGVTPDSVTIDHAPIPEANWPAMTMTFKAAPSIAEAVKAGDKVAFDLKLKGGAGEVTAIRKQ